jgi:alpha-ribazole phosphatase
MALRLLLVRHAETEWNRLARLQGQTDTRLSATGERQAGTLAVRLAGEEIDAVYASDLQRAWRTAEIAVAERGLPVHRDTAWREMSFGRWEGHTYHEVSESDPDLAERRLWDPAHVAPPGGENLIDVQRRVLPAAERLRRDHEGQTVLLVIHGGTLRVLVCSLLGMDLNHAWRLQADTGSVSCVRWYETLPVLELWNDTAHLRHPS